MAISDVTKNLIKDFFWNEFKDSRDFTLRISILPDDIFKDCLCQERIEVLLNDSNLVEFSKKYLDYIHAHKGERDSKTLVFTDIHNYQTFLAICEDSKIDVKPLDDANKLFLDDEIKFQFVSYMLKCESPDVCKTLADNIIKEYTDFDLIELLVFLGSHLEYRL